MTSMTAYSKLPGLSANWQLQPPSILSAEMMLSAAERSMEYSALERVMAGATTMLSPVCTPTGSTFSMLHTVTEFPALSRMTSNSISFQPAIHFSTSTCLIGERRSPPAAISLSSVSL